MNKNTKLTCEGTTQFSAVSFQEGREVESLYGEIEKLWGELVSCSDPLNYVPPAWLEERIIETKDIAEENCRRIIEIERKYFREHTELLQIKERFDATHKDACYRLASEFKQWGEK